MVADWLGPLPVPPGRGAERERKELEADGVDDSGEPGAESGAGYNFKQIAIVGEPQVPDRPKSGAVFSLIFSSEIFGEYDILFKNKS